MEMPSQPKAQESAIEYPQIAEEIFRMAEKDQSMRENSMENGAEWDPNVDHENTARMAEIVEQIGWPTRSKVGDEASHLSWLLVQHADANTVFQKRCLDLMRQAPEGEVEKEDIAYLTDRIQTAEKGTQTYGTQFRSSANEALAPWPIEDEDRVDERRSSMGMRPFAEHKETMLKKYGGA